MSSIESNQALNNILEKIGAKTPKLTVGVPGTEKVSISTEGIKAAGAKKKGPAKKKAGAKKK